MNKFIEFIKKKWKNFLIIFLIFLIMVLPLILNRALQEPAKNRWMEYSSGTGDLLTYFVSILSVVGTLLLGAVAYEQNKRLLKLESYSKKIFLKINIDQCNIYTIEDKTYLSIEFENINFDIPIFDLKIEECNKRIISNKFIENNKSNKKAATFITALQIQDDDKYTIDSKKVNYTFDISDYASVSYKIFSFLVNTESIYGENNKQLFNIFIVKSEVKRYLTKIE